MATAVSARRGLRHIGEALRSSWATLLKPLAWQGDLCFGPSRGSRPTFMRPEDASSRWAGVPDPDEAAPVAIVAYFRMYGRRRSTPSTTARPEATSASVGFEPVINTI